MTITAKVIADSVGEDSPRITTFELRYPRFIHSEFMTHRVFSRNASSSRAIPVERQIAAILEDTAMPIHWGKNQPGMQASTETNSPVSVHISERRLGLVESVSGFETYRGCVVDHTAAWYEARDRAIEVARAYHEAGYHKQIVNRLLEPFAHIKVVCTATNYSNFFALRRHPDAQPEIRALADAMYDAIEASDPEYLYEGQWHLPYITKDEWSSTRIIGEDGLDPLIKVSVARSARTSYKTHDGRPTTIAEDLALYARLVGSAPLHASPAEHQAKVDKKSRGVWRNPHLSGNFDPGWIQFRKTLPGECQ